MACLPKVINTGRQTSDTTASRGHGAANASPQGRFLTGWTTDGRVDMHSGQTDARSWLSRKDRVRQMSCALSCVKNAFVSL